MVVVVGKLKAKEQTLISLIVKSWSKRKKGKSRLELITIYGEINLKMTKTLKIEWPAWCVCCNLQSVCNVAQEWIWWLTLVTVCAWLCLLWLFAWEGSSSKMMKSKRNWLFYFNKIRLHVPSDPFRLFRPLRCEIRGDKKHTQLKEAKMIKSKCVYRGDSLLSVIS